MIEAQSSIVTNTSETFNFETAIGERHLLNHPFYQDWMKGLISPEMLQHYAKQYFYHVDRFPRYLSAIHSLCENNQERKEILQNLMDEEGVGYSQSHPDLWIQFAQGLGVSKEDVLSAKPESGIENVVATFFKYARSSYHEGLGALYAYECQVPEVAHSKIEGLKSQYNIHDEKTLAFFEIHKVADIEHRNIIRNMLENLPELQKRQAYNAAKEAAQSLWNFLTQVHTQKLSA